MLWYVVLGLFCAWLYSNRISSGPKQDRAARAAFASAASGRSATGEPHGASRSVRSTFGTGQDRLSPYDGSRYGVQKRKGSTGSFEAANSDELSDHAGSRAQAVHPDRLALVHGERILKAPRSDGSHRCLNCDLTFPHAAALTQHNIDRHSAKKSSAARPKGQPRCLTCNRTFLHDAALEQHNIDKHFSNIALTGSVWHGLPPPEHGGPMPVKCEVCDRESSNAFFLLQHQAHKHPWAVLCVDCKISFNSVDEARVHYANVHSDTTYLRREPISSAAPSFPAQRPAPPQANRRSPSAEQEVDLRFHLPYRCHMCDERFASAMDREEHISSPFGHGGSTAVQAAFPPLSGSNPVEGDARSSRRLSAQSSAMSRSSTASSRTDKSTERKDSLLRVLSAGPGEGAVSSLGEPDAIVTTDEGEGVTKPEVFAELIEGYQDIDPATKAKDEEENGPVNAITESHETGIDINQPLPVFTLTPSTSADNPATDTPVSTASPVSFEDNDWAVPDWAAETAETSTTSETSRYVWPDATAAVLDSADNNVHVEEEEEEPMLMLGERVPIPVPGPESFPPLPASPAAVKLDTPQSSPEKSGSGRWQDGSRIDFTPPVDSSHPSRRHLFRREPSEPDSDEDFPPSMRRDRPPSNIYSAVNDMCSPVSGSNSIPIGKRRSPANRYRIENKSSPQSALGLPARHATTPRFSGSSAHDTRPPNAHAQPTSARGWQHPAVIEPYTSKNDQDLAVDHAGTASPLGDDQAMIQEQVPCFVMQGDSAVPFNAIPDPPTGPPGPRPVPVHGSSARWSIPPPVQHPQPARASERWTARGFSSGPAYDPSNPRSWGSKSPTPSLDATAVDAPEWRVRSAAGQRSQSGSPARPPDDRSHVAHLYGQDSCHRQRKISTTSSSTSSAVARSAKHPIRSRHALEPQFAESEWQSVAPVAPTRKSRGGRAQTAAPVRVKETFAQKQMRQAELVWSGEPEPPAPTVADDEDDPYGGW